MSARGTKLRGGAYVTDGTGLHGLAPVRGTGHGVKVEIEDCMTFAARWLDVRKPDRLRLTQAANSDGG